MRKSGALLKAFLVFAVACIALTFVGGCSSEDSNDSYVVYKVTPIFKPVNPSKLYDSFDEYHIVHYKDVTDEDTIEFPEHKSDPLTAYDIEIHLGKSGGWTQDLVDDLVNETFAEVDSMSFATLTVTEKEDYFCVLAKFNELTTSSNAQEMVDKGILTLTGDDKDSESADRISAGYLMMSLDMQGDALTEEELSKLDLHFGS